ncbi:MAG: hypothetical protein JW849_03690 [Phycisphaerae bacterium]|nr:hypothetical protein [Phycisphaerae bacterium]
MPHIAPPPPRPARPNVNLIQILRPILTPPPQKIVEVVHVYNTPTTRYYYDDDREVFYITIVNRTGRTIELELDGDHEGDDDIGKLYPGEAMEYPLVVKYEDLPETFELEAGPHEADFRLTYDSPREFVLVVTSEGIYAE